GRVRTSGATTCPDVHRRAWRRPVGSLPSVCGGRTPGVAGGKEFWAWSPRPRRAESSETRLICGPPENAMGTTDEQRNELEALCAAAQAEDQLLAAHVAWLRQR